MRGWQNVMQSLTTSSHIRRDVSLGSTVAELLNDHDETDGGDCSCHSVPSITAATESLMLRRQVDYAPVNHHGDGDGDGDDQAENNDEAGLVPTRRINSKKNHDDDDDDDNSILLLQQSQQYAVAFFTLGLLNNASYCLMLACAKSISEGGTALVFLATVVPSLCVKASAPYWFHTTSYATRLRLAACIMGVAFVVVAICHAAENVYGQLLGVAIMAVQGGLGEASLLALAGKLDHDNDEQLTRKAAAATAARRMNHNHQDVANQSDSSSSFACVLQEAGVDFLNTERTISAGCLTSFSSGTGLSGVFAFFWKFLLTEWLGWTLEATLLSGLLLAISYHYVFVSYMADDSNYMRDATHNAIVSTQDEDEHPYGNQVDAQREQLAPLTSRIADMPLESDVVPTIRMDALASIPPQQPVKSPNSVPHQFPHHWTRRQRFHQICALWPYTIPLFTVYAAEYACMSGAWTAIGFPVTDLPARNRFYTTSNWLYQVGVFLSRSSGTLVTVSLPVLWWLPLLQCANLAFFIVTAASYASTVLVIPAATDNDSEHVTATFWLYSPLLFYGICLYTGLLGGAVYVHGYKRIVMDKPAQETEFALAATSVAESIGILVADVSGLFLQSCLYKTNGISGAVVACPA